MFRNGIFISYSHRDKKWLDLVLKFLKPYVRQEKITVWEDTQIPIGGNWDEEIKKHLENCRVAVLLVTPDFLASDYIAEHELPVLFDRNQKKDLIIYWVAVSHSAYKMTELEKIQSANNPLFPLDSLSETECNQKLVEIAEKIAQAVELNSIQNLFHIVDEFYPQQIAFLDDKPVDEQIKNFTAQAIQNHDKIELKVGEDFILETIRADELEVLDSDSKQLIQTYESTMKMLFDRWTKLQPKSYSTDLEEKKKAREEMEELRKDICAQLNSILNYLEHTLQKNLHDHYNHVRYICL